MIGVHYRGHDKVNGKWAEAARSPFASVLSLVLAVASRHKCTSVLAASDEPDFLTAYVTLYPLPSTIYHPTSIRGV